MSDNVFHNDESRARNDKLKSEASNDGGEMDPAVDCKASQESSVEAVVGNDDQPVAAKRYNKIVRFQIFHLPRHDFLWALHCADGEICYYYESRNCDVIERLPARSEAELQALHEAGVFNDWQLADWQLIAESTDRRKARRIARSVEKEWKQGI